MVLIVLMETNGINNNKLIGDFTGYSVNSEFIV